MDQKSCVAPSGGSFELTQSVEQKVSRALSASSNQTVVLVLVNLSVVVIIMGCDLTMSSRPLTTPVVLLPPHPLVLLLSSRWRAVTAAGNRAT